MFKNQEQLDELNKMEKNAIKLFTKLKVSKANFIFSCGGDSMNDTSWEIYGQDDNIIDTKEVGELRDILDSLVYEKVEFYEVSDGHYIGEDGVVTITVAKATKKYLNYEKTSKAEWEEEYGGTLHTKLTQEEATFWNNKIRGIAGESDEGHTDIRLSYKSDTILPPSEIELQNSILDKIKEELEDDGSNIVWDTDDGEYLRCFIDDNERFTLNQLNELLIPIRGMFRVYTERDSWD